MTPATAHELRLLNAEKRKINATPGQNFDMGRYIGNRPWLLPVEHFYDAHERVSLADCSHSTLATLAFRMRRKGLDTADINAEIAKRIARSRAALDAALAEIIGKQKKEAA